MNASEQTFANLLQIEGNFENYHVPKYQRDYAWGSYEWEQLLNDIEENEVEYFVGSIICISENVELIPGATRVFEVVDGQQRLVTLSLVLMAIYYKLSELKNSLTNPDEDEIFKYKKELANIENRLVSRKSKVIDSDTGYYSDKSSKNKYFSLRVQPSTQNNNLKDYLHILGELEVIKGDYRSNYCGVRRLYKAYTFFYNNLPDNYDDIKVLLDKIYSLKFIHISVGTSSDAFVLFETLNNRGIPLSAMDIIKNKMLAQLERQNQMDIDEAYEEWLNLLKYLPEYNDQERFLRQYYNAFKIYPEIKIEKYTRATRSNLIKIYETYIKKNAEATIKSLLNNARIYNCFIEPYSNGFSEARSKYLFDLQRIGSAPSYLFLLYLWNLPEDKMDNREEVIDDLLQFFIKYYLRRNITDIPNTRDLDAINMDIIEKCETFSAKGNKLSSQFIIDMFVNGKEKPASLIKFKESLENNLLNYNYYMARFVLAKLDETFHSKEYKPDLWARNEKGLYVWTVEHIFPQGDNITQDWVNMIAGGDREKAEAVRQKWVHSLGNLTLSGYNSQLSNASFNEKQSLHEDKMFLGYKINIGYKNGLSLNEFPFTINGEKTSLAEVDEWTEDSIIARNDAIVDFTLKLFAFDEEELKVLESGD